MAHKQCVLLLLRPLRPIFVSGSRWRPLSSFKCSPRSIERPASTHLNQSLAYMTEFLRLCGTPGFLTHFHFFIFYLFIFTWDLGFRGTSNPKTLNVCAHAAAIRKAAHPVAGEDAELHIANALVHLEARAARIGRVVLKVIPHEGHIRALVVVATPASLYPAQGARSELSKQGRTIGMQRNTHPANLHACIPATAHQHSCNMHTHYVDMQMRVPVVRYCQ